MIKLFKKAMDPISSETHFISACLSLIGLFIMISVGLKRETAPMILGAAMIFGSSLIALYSASATYHFFKRSQKIKVVLRELDHSTIYVLIVGTYTPAAMYCMETPHFYYFLGILWVVVIIGILVKIIWLSAPRAITTAIYLILGWTIVLDLQSFTGIPVNCLMMIATGGIAYSIGAFIYIFKKSNLTESFGFHELFHIFVMLDSLLHCLAILMFIL